MQKSLAGPLLAALSLAFAPAPLPRPGASKEDLKKMQGRWNLVACQCGGRPTGMPLEGEACFAIIIVGNRLTYRVGTGEGDEWLVTLRGAISPAGLDMQTTKKSATITKIKAVYSLKGDTLIVCHNNGSGDRPRTIDSRESGHWVEVFKRPKR
jgi:uncharacterized protein (TIGR03067 family)